MLFDFKNPLKELFLKEKNQWVNMEHKISNISICVLHDGCSYGFIVQKEHYLSVTYHKLMLFKYGQNTTTKYPTRSYCL
jgi:hypothetical protein